MNTIKKMCQQKTKLMEARIKNFPDTDLSPAVRGQSKYFPRKIDKQAIRL